MGLVEDVRTLFEAKVNEHRASGKDVQMDPVDLEKLKDDAYIERYLRHKGKVPADAAEMLYDVLVWRKLVGANQINETNLNMEYIREGAFYPHGRDIDGSVLLVFHCKLHVKGQKDIEDLKKCIIYWFDRVDRQENGKKVTLFFDMESCGLSNMDMEFTKFLINLTKYYYPAFLNYIIIYEMPWVLTTAFKIIKGLLPAEAAAKMKFLGKSSLSQLVAPEQALVCWGGKSDYKFEFSPEVKESNSEKAPKKVTFDEQNNSQHSQGELLKITPSDGIMFREEVDEVSGQFTITNMDVEEKPVSFKIRTTAAEKFRVRPSTGTIAHGASQKVLIVVQPGVPLKSVVKDRFLVMCIQIPKVNLSSQELSELWQKSGKCKVDEYRLKCLVPEKLIPKNTSGSMETKDIEKVAVMASTIEKLQTDYAGLNKQIASLKRLQVVTMFITLTAVTFAIFGWLSMNDVYYSLTR